MTRGTLENASLSTRLLVVLSIVLGSFILFSLAGTLLAMVIYRVDPAAVMQESLDLDLPGMVPMLRFMQVFQSAGLFFIPPFLVAWFLSTRPMQFLGFERRPSGFSLLAGSLVLIVAIPLVNQLADWNSSIRFPEFLQNMESWMRVKEEQANELTEAFLRFDRPGDYWRSLLIVALLPGIGEELLFRGLIQRMLREWFGNIHLAILGASILFSAIHLQFFGFLPRLLMGMWFGYLLVWTGSLWLPILAHFVNNGLIVTYYYFTETGVIKQDFEHVGTEPGSSWLVFVSILLTGWMVWLVFRNEKKRERELP